MDIVDKLKSQIGDDPQHIFDHEALFKLAVTEIERQRDGIDAIRQYGSDTLRGPIKSADDTRDWQRDAVLEMTNRAVRILSGQPWLVVAGKPMNDEWWCGKALDQGTHAAINAGHYPGTRQLCSVCDEPTGRCEDDTIDGPDGPLCESCYTKDEEGLPNAD